MPTTTARLVLVSCPTEEVAARLSRALVDERLAACVTSLPGARSTYRWKDAVETADELVCLIKTTTACLPALMKRVVELHPYEVPELLVVPIEDGLPAYLGWLAEQTRA